MSTDCFPQMNIKLTKKTPQKQTEKPPKSHRTKSTRASNFDLKRFPRVAALGLRLPISPVSKAVHIWLLERVGLETAQNMVKKKV